VRPVKISNLKLGAVFLLSAAIIAYELAVMRSFSVGSWSNFGSMVISIALLGYGLAGTILTFIQKAVKKNIDAWLSCSALLLPPAMAAGHVLAQYVPFNPVLIVSDPVQLWWIGAYYLIYSIPFLCGAFFIGIAFIALSSRMYHLYFWNMAGSGLGGFFILGCMYLFSPETLIIPVLIITFPGGILCYITWNHSGLSLTGFLRLISGGTACLVISIVLVLSIGKISVNEFKAVSYVRKFPEYHLDHYSFSPLGEIHVYSSSYFHFAPGLSDNAMNEPDSMPVNAFKGLYIDGVGPIGIMKKLPKNKERYIDFLPMTAPYKLFNRPEVLLVGLGGGTGVFTAFHHNAEKVAAVEPNPDIIRLMKEVAVIREFNGNLLKNPAVEIFNGQPRAHCRTTTRKFDIIELSLIDSVGLSQTGGYPVVENFTYTAEGIDDYMSALEDNGILSITVWNKLNPPRNVLRLLATIVTSLGEQGVEHPENRLFMFHMLLQTATVLVKNSDYTEGEIEKLQNFCSDMSFDVTYYPGIPERNRDFKKILSDYTDLFGSRRTFTIEIDDEEGDRGLLSLLELVSEEEYEDEEQELDPGDLYHFSLRWMLSGREEELFNHYIFDIRPATDDRPYYTAYLKPQTIGMFLNQLNKISEEWGYLMLVGTLFQSLIFGALIIVLPLVGRWKELFNKRRGTAGVILYYACLGLGYMLVEIFLIQKLVFFLEEPIFSLSIVITVMLIVSGTGSLFGGRYIKDRIKGVRLAAACICVSLVFYVFALTPLLRLLLFLPFFIKLLCAIVFIAPAAFFMGIPFPSGLASLTENREVLLPWAWGMNGALSVTGSVLARLFSVSAGFTPVLICAMILYGLAGFVFPANQGRMIVGIKKKGYG
jgi:hypothetical protein